MRALIVAMLLSAPALATENTVVRGNSEFAFDLHRKLAPAKENLVFSPYSISSAMALVWAGARGPTAREIAIALRFGNEADVHPAFHALNEQLAQVHKAFIDVNEEGTEAAAATSVLWLGLGSPPPSEPEFRADHPFLFVLRDRKSGTILFVGRVVDPKE